MTLLAIQAGWMLSRATGLCPIQVLQLLLRPAQATVCGSSKRNRCLYNSSSSSSSSWNFIFKYLSSQIIKDFYLLGRGELFQAFIDTAQHMLKTPPTAVTEHGESHAQSCPLCMLYREDSKPCKYEINLVLEQPARKTPFGPHSSAMPVSLPALYTDQV